MASRYAKVSKAWIEHNVTLAGHRGMMVHFNLTVGGMKRRQVNVEGEVTLDSGKAIETAEGAYDALTDEQKALVENYDTLLKARADYNRLKAEYVEGLIEKLPKAGEITLKDGDNVKAAGDAYDKLTEDQKKLVSADSVKKLESVRAAYAKIAPKTGDSMSIAIYALLLVAAAATGTVVYKKKKKA